MDPPTPLAPVPPPPVCAPAPSGVLTPRTIQIEFPQHSSSLLEALNRHRLEGKFCDVSLQVQGRELRAHKAVLAAASPYFHDKLLLGDAPKLTLPNVIEADAFEGLLQLIYSGRLRLPLEALPSHLLVASGLQMWQVVDQCSEILRELSGGTTNHTLFLSSSSPRVWCSRPAPPQPPVQPPAPTENPGGAMGGELGEVLKIQVEEEEEEEEEEEDEEEQKMLSVVPQVPQRVGGGTPRPRAHNSLPIPNTTRRLPDGEGVPAEPPIFSTPLPPKIFYIKQEKLDREEEVVGGGGQPERDLEESREAFSGGTGGGELGFLLPPGAEGASSGGGPSWKPVDLHGNEILSGGGGPGGTGQAVHGPVKLGGAPPPDGKRFGCLCGKRFAVKPKRDRHIMLTFSLRPFGCGVCNKRFKLKHHLTEHMKTHAVALHACPHCGRRFRVHACFLRHRELCKGQGWATAHWTYK
ncbi:zinc finger and BTB domain-containing protein 9 [Antechinus flavipes]|uniref:zinc finger and BTB domain-containing protein 9 n=1 Tax=Antechinus flavipes TaxID=38775 RepID=UPI0022357AE8|nr:zinc finger and BTB domain-containing protein 9 [Antechinus flavipes]XP_051852362.1 zinc finger and BTB domain-containing protein 9 [Antechinus flavipes]